MNSQIQIITQIIAIDKLDLIICFCFLVCRKDCQMYLVNKEHCLITFKWIQYQPRTNIDLNHISDLDQFIQPITQFLILLSEKNYFTSSNECANLNFIFIGSPELEFHYCLYFTLWLCQYYYFANIKICFHISNIFFESTYLQIKLNSRTISHYCLY